VLVKPFSKKSGSILTVYTKLLYFSILTSVYAYDYLCNMRNLIGRKGLLEALKQAGLPSSSTWLWNKQNDGSLELPRVPNSQSVILTEEQIGEIVKAFSPSGEGRWSC